MIGDAPGRFPARAIAGARARLGARALAAILAFALPGLAAPARADRPVSDEDIAARFPPAAYFRGGIAGALMARRDFPSVLSSYDPSAWCAHLDAAVDRSFHQNEIDWDTIVFTAARRAIPGDQLRGDPVPQPTPAERIAARTRFAAALSDAGAGPFLEARTDDIVASLRRGAATSQAAVSDSERETRLHQQVADKTFLCHLVPPQTADQPGVSK